MRAPERDQRWGVLGGIFDPVHLGHLHLAKDIFYMAQLDGVLFVPSYNPPHRKVDPVESFDHRLRMLTMALRPFPGLAVSTIERDLTEPGYTLNVIRALKTQYPEVIFEFIVGADNLRSFKTWYEWRELLDEVHLLVGSRPGASLAPPADLPADRVRMLTTSEIGVSSTDIRRLISAGASRQQLAEVLPPAVADYITKHGLYTDDR